MSASVRRHPDADELRSVIDEVVDEPVRFVETRYGYSCHVTDVEASSGTSFAAVDVDRRVPQIYFDAGAARGRKDVETAQDRVSIAYVIERLLDDPDRLASHLAGNRDRYAPYPRDTEAAEVSPDGGPLPPDAASPVTFVAGRSDPVEVDVAALSASFTDRCQYLHSRRAARTGGPHTGILEAFEREPLTNDKLGQQFGWRVATSPRQPDLPAELLVMESHAQVLEAYRT